MKFGDSIGHNSVPEWKDQYVDYKAGKKIIKAVKTVKSTFGEGGDINDGSNTKPIGDDRTPLLGPLPTQDIGSNKNLGFEDGSKFSLDSGGEGATSSSTAPRKLSNRSRNGSKSKKDDLELLNPAHKIKTGKSQSAAAFKNISTSIFHSGGSNRSKKIKGHIYQYQQLEFNTWLNNQIIKVESFFRTKEQENYERFLVLEDQLYQLKDHRNSSIRRNLIHSKQHHSNNPDDDTMFKKVNDVAVHTKTAIFSLNRFDLPSLPSTTFLNNWKLKNSSNDELSSKTILNFSEDEVGPNYIENRIRNGKFPERANNDSSPASDSDISTNVSENVPVPNDRAYTQTPEMINKSKKRDYEVKKIKYGVPYLFARKQLKEAVLEYYRALMILKSYKEMNRTAFRKITKKYDKSLNMNTSKEFMEKLDKQSYFLTSDILDKLVFQVEELYMSFFDPESSDRKHSLEKLKRIAYSLNYKEVNFNTNYLELFTVGFCLGCGIPLFAVSIYQAVYKILNNQLPEGVFMLQIYGGFFLMLLMFLLFGSNLIIFDKFKINYKFIFEFNITTALNYRQYLLIPSISFLILSLVMFFSFSDFWPDQFAGRDYPWIYFGISLVIFFWPFNQFYFSSRRWLQIALFRLLFSGFYPVEFRDFFLGDLFSSMTYSMGNISFFFCLFANHWNGIVDGVSDPHNQVCGSSRSRSMGFFAALPSIWRFLQCIRRYADSGDWFPHLANMLKYGITATYVSLLSVYRIEKIERNRIAFIVMAIINSLYTSAWDILMDWSLLKFDAKHKLLRDNLFFKRPIYYYLAMVFDVTFRFQWIFYAFFSNQIQQLAVTSFMIGLAEIFRRIVWALFRMENEHCTNVTLFRASRDSPLPYPINEKVENAIKELVELRYKEYHPIEPLGDTGISKNDGGKCKAAKSSLPPPVGETESVVGLSKIQTASTQYKPVSSQRRSTLGHISDALNKAHIKDFQRKTTLVNEESDEDDEEDDDEEEEENEEGTTSRQETRTQIDPR